MDNNFFQILNSKEYLKPLSSNERLVLINQISLLVESEDLVFSSFYNDNDDAVVLDCA